MIAEDVAGQAPGRAPRYLANREVSRREEEGGTLLYDPDADEVTIVNATGAELLDALDEPRTVDELAGRLVAVFSGVDLERARADVLTFLDDIPDNFVSAV
jgi:hypothetical protein